MKPVILLLTCILLSTTAFSQVGIGTETPDASAALDITSTTQGLLPPRMTAAQRDAIATLAQGLMIYCTDCGTNGEIQFYNGAAWVNVVGGDAAVPPPPSITSSTGKIWMDRNLGATQVAISKTDHLAYGDLYQWGRKADGHEKINWTNGTTGAVVNGTTTTKADVPADALFIIAPSSPFDWRVNQNNNLWSGVAAVNNPCPAGFRVPTIIEINAEVDDYHIIDSDSAFDSPLKFTGPGTRRHSSGALNDVGSFGVYWSSSVSGTLATGRYFYAGGTIVLDNRRANGLTVRCLKN